MQWYEFICRTRKFLSTMATSGVEISCIILWNNILVKCYSPSQQFRLRTADQFSNVFGVDW